LTEKLPYKPIQGKTYSLFGDSLFTEGYFILISKFTDELLKNYPDEKTLLKVIRDLTKSKRRFLKWKGSLPFSANKFDKVSQYTLKTAEYLKTLSLSGIWDGRLRTKEWQYHLYMLEIELTNRINKPLFSKSEFKMALLPYCLHDLKKECKSSSDGLEYVCRTCSKECYINNITKTLAESGVKGYIWMQAGLGSLLKKLSGEYKTIGILGIACIPELVNGMRKCDKYSIPAIGIPLDANRCVRWMGEFYDNSVNLDQLERLLSDNL
jgi:uncharacterized protein